MKLNNNTEKTTILKINCIEGIQDLFFVHLAYNKNVNNTILFKDFHKRVVLD